MSESNVADNIFDFDNQDVPDTPGTFKNVFMPIPKESFVDIPNKMVLNISKTYSMHGVFYVIISEPMYSIGHHGVGGKGNGLRSMRQMVDGINISIYEHPEISISKPSHDNVQICSFKFKLKYKGSPKRHEYLFVSQADVKKSDIFIKDKYLCLDIEGLNIYHYEINHKAKTINPISKKEAFNLPLINGII